MIEAPATGPSGVRGSRLKKTEEPTIKQKRHPTEEIIRILREADAGKDLEAVCRQHNVSAAS